MTLDQDTYQDELEMLRHAYAWKDNADARDLLQRRIVELLVHGGGWGMTCGPQEPGNNEYRITGTNAALKVDRAGMFVLMI